jgi:ring-1,2-phenylacetyl-CoA epoxidase subunit PaaC
VAPDVEVVLAQVLEASRVETPSVAQVGPVAGGRGRDGRHTEALSHLLAEMQSVARAHPQGTW